MDTYDPLDPQQQEALLWSHPLVTKRYIAVTPSMPKVLGMVVDCVMYHKGCLVFKAYPRMGKTTALKFTAAALGKIPHFEDRFVLSVTADTKGDRKSRENIVRIMAKALGIPVKPHAKFISIKDDVRNHIESQLRNRGGRHWVLFLDELQTLVIDEFEDLQDLQNKLALHDIDTTLIGFSQPQIKHAITLLESQKRSELLVRFLYDVRPLPYCTDPTWMADTLKGYDERFTYPEGSGCTFTQFYLPRAYATGFRLSSIAPDIYRVMSSSANVSKLPLLPTEFVFEVFRQILFRAMKKDAPNFSVTQEIIVAATKEAKLEDYIRLLKNSGAQ